MPLRLSELTGQSAVAYRNDPVILGLASDSRIVKPGFLFAALPGVANDGAAFAKNAVEKGAVAILADRAMEDLPVPVIVSANPRLALAQMAKAFHHGQQPDMMAAVTGTNGKTSTAHFIRQIWSLCGHKAASLGTLGVTAPDWNDKGGLTTPDTVTLHDTLSRLHDSGVSHACMEASSHGLDQYRLDGVTVKIAAFTNLTRDHLDYHADMAAYGQAKLRLFSEILSPDGMAIVNSASDFSPTIIAACRKRDIAVLTYGTVDADIALLGRTALAHGQDLSLRILGQEFTLSLPLAGEFQALNVLCALGIAIASGIDRNQAVAACERLEGVPGRLQNVAQTPNGAPIFIDYAHTPDALETVLHALRPHVENRLAIVFGCGGDRDPGKRPQMGAIAAHLADWVIVTDDNPRSEDPAGIRSQILAACPNGIEIADRAEAIKAAIAGLETGDVLVVAGKGHESGQIVGDRVLPFDDAEEVRSAVEGRRS